MSGARGYEAAYEAFDTPLMRQVRREAYGEDVGQHSWVTADELRADVVRLRLGPSSRLLDLGCGPCGPLTFVLRVAGCAGTGVDQSGSGLAAGRARAAALGLEDRMSLQQADLDAPLPFAAGTFDAAMSLDVVLHLRDRARLFGEVSRVLSPGGRFLFTDAGVVTGAIASDEVALRAAHGFTQLAPADLDPRLMALAGFRLVETEDRTEAAARSAARRRTARETHRAELEALEGAAAFEAEQRYLDTVAELSRRRALSRFMYLAEAHAA